MAYGLVGWLIRAPHEAFICRGRSPCAVVRREDLTNAEDHFTTYVDVSDFLHKRRE